MVSLPKINLGLSTRKSFFDKTHDVSTTADFGFCAPTLIDEVIKDTDINLDTSSLVRFAPLPQPSFGRVQLRQYNVFVPMTQVFEAFDYMMSEQSVSSANGTYTPITADYVTANTLFGFIFGHNWDEQLTPEFKRLAIPVFWARITAQGQITNDVTVPLKSVVVDSDLIDRVWYSYKSLGGYPFEGNKYNFSNGLSVGNNLITSSLPDQYYNYVKPSFENADFVMPSKIEDIDVYFTWHLTHEGARLMKVLKCIGLSAKYNHRNFPLAPLFAYYKGWFDIFNPGRDIQWKATACYKLIHSYYDLGTVTNTRLQGTTVPFSAVGIFKEFLTDLYNCCYTLDIDPLTVCLNKPFENSTMINGNLIVGSDSGDILTNSIQNGDYQYGFVEPKTDVYDAGSLTTRFLLKLLPFVNKNTVIGKRVDEYLKVHGINQVIPDTYLFGKNKLNLDITAVISSSDTATETDGVKSGSNLGEYAGQSVGGGSFKSNYHAKAHGYVIQYSVIVPFGGYSQDIPELDHFTRYDFYNHEFDSLGYEAVSTARIYGQSSVYECALQERTFGFRPRLMGYKYKNNMRLGDFARRGTVAQLLPYQLDRVFTEHDFIYTQRAYAGSVFYDVIETNEVSPQVNESLRYIGQTEDYGNYNRIFYDNTGNTDNFIVHMVHDYKLHSPMLPISDSFDTFDNEGLKDDNTTISSQHS